MSNPKRNVFACLTIALISWMTPGVPTAHSQHPSAAQIKYRIFRFTAQADGSVGPRDPDGHYRSTGTVTPDSNADEIFGPGRKAQWHVTVDPDVDGKGGFLYSATISFAGGVLNLRSTYIAHSEETVLPNVHQAVMIDRVIGGTGAFDGATGYLLFNDTLGATLTGAAPKPAANQSAGDRSPVLGCFAGIIFLPERQ